MGKSTISMAIFNSFLYVHQRVDHCRSVGEDAADTDFDDFKWRITDDQISPDPHRVIIRWMISPKWNSLDLQVMKIENNMASECPHSNLRPQWKNSTGSRNQMMFIVISECLLSIFHWLFLCWSGALGLATANDFNSSQELLYPLVI